MRKKNKYGKFLNILRKEKLLELSEVIKENSFRGGPYHAEIEITDRCNANCYFCNQRELNAVQKEMSYSCFKDILLTLCKQGLRVIRLSGGGEPTTHSEILKILDLISCLKLRINFFNTNGILLTPEISQKLIQNRLEVLQISLNSSNPKTWAKINGCKEDDFYRVLDNIRVFKQYDKFNSVYIMGSFVIDKPTYKELHAMEALCKKLNIELHIKDLNNYIYSDYFRTACIPIFLKELFALIDSKNINSFLFFNIPELYNFLRILPASLPNQIKNLPCLAPWASILIRANGDVYPCCALSSKRYKFGNIFRKKFMDIWIGDGFQKLRSEYKEAMVKYQENKYKFRPKHSFRYFRKQIFLNCPVKGMFYRKP